MSYQIEPFVRTLREARRKKGWSQRDLSQKAGIPQAHISRIEAGLVDPKVSTLVELARLLDHDLFLAPRAARPAVDALIREAEANTETRAVQRTISQIAQAVQRLREADPGSRAAERLADVGSDFAAMAPVSQSPRALVEVTAVARALDAAVGARPFNLAQVERAIDRLVHARNELAQAPKQSQTPAYSLDDED